jgi:RHS repeat-associated protein
MVNYDKRGNISSLTRNTFDDINGALQIDNLTYTYNSASNQLSKIADASNNAQGFNINGALSSAAYTYDLNGSLRTDPYKKITSINYYYNNLPKEIVFNFGVSNINRIRFTYDAMGTKLRKQVLNNSGTVTAQQDYVDGIEYNNNVIEAIYHSAGRAVWNGSAWRYEFNVTDHLGNVRAVISDLNNDKILNFTQISTTHEIINSFAQYPFGMAMANDGAFNNTLTPDTKYRYNGKELNEDLGLNMYDYGARFYDPSIGRFTTVDPLADEMVEWSPYNYTFNNPINMIDPDGRAPWPITPMGFGYLMDKLASRVKRAIGYEKQGYTATSAHVKAFGDDVGGLIRDAVDEIPGAGEFASAVEGDYAGAALGLIPGGKKMRTVIEDVSDASSVSKKTDKIKNPFGSKGKPDHQAKVDELAKKAAAENPDMRIVTERKIQGHDSKRKPDVQVIDPNTGKAKYIYEAERRPESTRNKKREEEYKRLNIPNETHRVGN